MNVKTRRQKKEAALAMQKKQKIQSAQKNDHAMETEEDVFIQDENDNQIPFQSQFAQQLQIPQFDQENDPDFNLNSQVMNIEVSDFESKIPNKAALIDFFENQCQKYLPPNQELTMKFFKQILAGEKQLLPLNRIQWIKHVPNFRELNCRTIWTNMNKNSQVLIYFPDYSQKQYPCKEFMLNVLNSIQPGFILKEIQRIADERKKKGTKQKIDPIIITNEYSRFLAEFQTIHDKKKGKKQSMKFLQTHNYSTCPLCLQDIKSIKKHFFKCKIHEAHDNCIKTYQNSELAQNSQYLCPYRCVQQD